MFLSMFWKAMTTEIKFLNQANNKTLNKIDYYSVRRVLSSSLQDIATTHGRIRKSRNRQTRQQQEELITHTYSRSRAVS